MDSISYKTLFAKKEENEREWLIIDAQDKVLGRLSSEVAKLLRGKHKPNFTPHADCGAKVVIVNARHIKLTKDKKEKKMYIWHTGYPGGQKTISAEELQKKSPNKLIYHAVKGMLPKNKLSRHQLKNLFIFPDNIHNKQAQKPKEIQL